MRKSYLWMVAVIGMATAWSSCSKEDNGLDITENVEIMAKSKALTLDVETKAPFEGTIADNNLTARVLVSTTTANYTTTHANGTMTFTDNGSTAVGFNASGFSGNKAYPGSSQIYMVGLYPAAIGDGGWSTFGETTTHPIDGKSDIMTAPQINTDKATGAKTLAFSHKLTKLNVLVLADGSDETARTATSNAWGKITDLSLTHTNIGGGDGTAVSMVATVTLSTGNVAFGSTGSSIPFYKATASTYSDNAVSNLGTDGGIAIPNAEAATRVAYSLVTPVTLLTGDEVPESQDAYILSIKTENATTAIAVKIKLKPNEGVTSTAGKAFDVTLTFKGTEITAKATVTAWAAGGSGAGTIE